MNAKNIFIFYVAFVVLLLCAPATAMAITADELANICEAMESAIVDLSVEYEWFADSPMSLEEKLEFIADKPMVIAINIPSHKLVCSLAAPDAKNPDASLFDKFVCQQAVTLMRDPNEVWDSLTKRSCNRQIAKSLTIGSFPPSAPVAIISKPDNVLEPYATPLDFSVFRFRLRKSTDRMPLSAALRLDNSKQSVRIDNTVRKVNDANSISVDFLRESTGTAYMRVYFSLDHGYTPVRYEYLSGPKPEAVAATVEVTSLEEVAPGLWFPSGGAMLIPDHTDEEGNYYQASSKILVNQGLTDEHFDIEFPPGTKVTDEIKGTKYVVEAQ